MPRKGYRVCSRCERGRAERFFTGTRGRVCASCKKGSRSKSTHESRVQEVYGLRPGEYDALFDSQGGRCAICQGVRRQRLSVDHCHRTGLVRGLICRMCNGRMLPAARDNPETLRSAADYLTDPPAVRVLGPRYVVTAPMRRGHVSPGARE